ncbi:MAG: D-2-hydroxyacid dehydrogenase [Opitutaceae bacterium]|nr:D-2-hydroxyacid dehydrogenase [Opitutaceae bacterium]
MPLTIWCNGKFDDAATRLLVAGTREHKLVWARETSANVLEAGRADSAVERAEVLFGQPAVEDCLRHERVRWAAVTSAGYARYDTPEFKEALRARGGIFTNMSAVFADPCAQHVLAMMLALGRNLLPSYRDQLRDQSWHYEERRYESALLTGQTVLLLGYGAIARRLVELLAPFDMKIYAVRRQVCSERGVRVIAEDRLSSVLGEADHIVNLLPDNAATRGYVNARRLSCCKRGARYYNVGRGSTDDPAALVEALNSGRLGRAYLDVFNPEPLAPDHPFWTTRNCYVTPHTAGGRADQDEAIVRHFLANLGRFASGSTELVDRVV